MKNKKTDAKPAFQMTAPASQGGEIAALAHACKDQPNPPNIKDRTHLLQTCHTQPGRLVDHQQSGWTHSRDSYS